MEKFQSVSKSSFWSCQNRGSKLWWGGAKIVTYRKCYFQASECLPKLTYIKRITILTCTLNKISFRVMYIAVRLRFKVVDNLPTATFRCLRLEPVRLNNAL